MDRTPYSVSKAGTPSNQTTRIYCPNFCRIHRPKRGRNKRKGEKKNNTHNERHSICARLPNTPRVQKGEQRESFPSRLGLCSRGVPSLVVRSFVGGWQYFLLGSLVFGAPKALTKAVNECVRRVVDCLLRSYYVCKMCHFNGALARNASNLQYNLAPARVISFSGKWCISLAVPIINIHLDGWIYI